MVELSAFVSDWSQTPFAKWGAHPWEITAKLERRVAAELTLLGDGYAVAHGVAIHRTARVESGAILKAPCIVGPGCFVAAGAYLRAGTLLVENVVVGPGVELKAALVFPGTCVAHFNFVGDSILGRDVNIEAGAVVANSRNERADKCIRIRLDGKVIDTGAEKFGALIGDGARIGANAVIAPGALIRAGQTVQRLALIDQDEG